MAFYVSESLKGKITEEDFLNDDVETKSNFVEKFYLKIAAPDNEQGSIERICGIAASNATTVDNGVTGIFHSLKYDDGTVADITGSQNEVHQQFAHNVEVHAGRCLDGPFMAVHVNAEPCLIYHNGIANTEAS